MFSPDHPVSTWRYQRVNADKQRPILLLSFGGSMCFQKCRELSLSFLPLVFPLNPELLYAWLKSNLFNAIELLTLQSFCIFNLISSLKCPCEVGRAGIIKPIWIMSKKSPRRWSVLLHIPREEILVSWLLSQWLSFLFFIIPGILSDLDILFSNSLVSWLRLDRKEKEGCGRWTVGGDAGERRSRRGKCLHDLHINSYSLARERSGHLPIMMCALWYLMEMVLYLPHQKLICPGDTQAQHSKNEIPPGASFWNWIWSH